MGASVKYENIMRLVGLEWSRKFFFVLNIRKREKRITHSVCVYFSVLIFVTFISEKGNISKNLQNLSEFPLLMMTIKSIN